MTTGTNQTAPSESAAESLPTPSFVKPSQRANATTKQSKRATLNFPILLPQSNVDTCSYSSFPGLLTPAESQCTSPPPTVKPPTASPQDSSEFLTLLAAQERKVLELREELQKAEADLLALKNQWARYEAHKKKHEVRHGERMETITLNFAKRPVDGSTSLKKPLDEEDSKVVRGGGRRTQPRVFSSSKHARTLSLLSPTLENQAPIRTSSIDDLQRPPVLMEIEEREPKKPVSDQDEGKEVATSNRTEKELFAGRSLQSPSRDTIVRTSKQVASDLREGLWTFFEDIRQATVGEEGISGTESRGVRFPSKNKSEFTITPRSKIRDQPCSQRKRSSIQASVASARETSAKNNEVSFWQEFGIDTPGESHAKQDKGPEPEKGVKASPLVDVDDNWDIWDTWDTPTFQTRLSHRATTTPESAASIPPAVTEMTTNALPWPELKKFTPSKLTRTVSDLMKEWDSLSIESPQSREKAGDVDECTKTKT